jgi:hypothetical protein
VCRAHVTLSPDDTIALLTAASKEDDTLADTNQPSTSSCNVDLRNWRQRQHELDVLYEKQKAKGGIIEIKPMQIVDERTVRDEFVLLSFCLQLVVVLQPIPADGDTNTSTARVEVDNMDTAPTLRHVRRPIDEVMAAEEEQPPTASINVPVEHVAADNQCIVIVEQKSSDRIYSQRRPYQRGLFKSTLPL